MCEWVSLVYSVSIQELNIFPINIFFPMNIFFPWKRNQPKSMQMQLLFVYTNKQRAQSLKRRCGSVTCSCKNKMKYMVFFVVFFLFIYMSKCSLYQEHFAVYYRLVKCMFWCKSNKKKDILLFKEVYPETKSIPFPLSSCKFEWFWRNYYQRSRCQYNR